MASAKDRFIDTYWPVAVTVGGRLGVAPATLIGQWGLETGWGKSIIPGTNNLGNIKDFSGGGVSAKDNMLGSTDKYRKFDSPQSFGEHYVGLINRKYPDAIGTGDDAQAFGTALKKGGYAEDPDYPQKIVAMNQSVQKAPSFMERAVNFVVPPAQAGTLPADRFDDIFQPPSDAGAMSARTNADQDPYADIFAAPQAMPETSAPVAQQNGSFVDSAIDTVAGVGAGLGQGVGQVALGAQNLVGKGLQAVGANDAGNWLVNDAKQGRAALDEQAAPYAKAAPTAASIGRIGGNIVATWPVGGVLGKAVGAGAKFMGPAANTATKLGESLRTYGMKAGGHAPTLAGRVSNIGLRATGGAVTGAASAGLISPEDSAAGAAMGALFPFGASVLGAGGRGALSLAEPFYQGGRNKIIGRALRNSAGNQADDAVRNLNNAQPLVPGTRPTAAEVAQNPGIAAVQRTATALDPVVMNETAARQAANNEARAAVLTDLSGADGARAAALTARDEAAANLYDKAFAAPFDVATLTGPQSQEMGKLMGMPAVRDATKQARINAANAGIDMTTGGSIAGLHQSKLAMDDQINKLMGGTAAEVNRAKGIMAARDRLVSFIESVSPDYKVARETYTNLSKPINQMDTVQKVADKSTNKLTGDLYPAQLARALSDDTARQATGNSTATLAGTLSPEQLGALNAVKQDLGRVNFANTAGRGVGSDTVQKMAFGNMLDQAGIGQGVRSFGPAGVVGNVLQRGGQALYGGANNTLQQQLAEALLDPSTTARLMSSTMITPEMRALVQGLQQTGAHTAPVLTAQ